MPFAFPAISDLPTLFDATNWSWHSPPGHNRHIGIKPEWWIGTDETGTRWLVKMRGSSMAHREHVFAALAQRLNISCQSSSYLLMPSHDSVPRIHSPDSEDHQLALVLLEEHEPISCSSQCLLSTVWGKTLTDKVMQSAELVGSSNYLDLVRGSALGFMCGQSEPSDFIITPDHDYVVIDNEMMFGCGSCLLDCEWFKTSSRQSVVEELCLRLVEIPDEDLAKIATPPANYPVSDDLEIHLLAAKEGAARYLNQSSPA